LIISIAKPDSRNGSRRVIASVNIPQKHKRHENQDNRQFRAFRG
jgi:hypothetical protein